jgi:uracil DNA glycosylase
MYLPGGGNVLRAFKQSCAVRVLIVGQDPFPRGSFRR